MSVTAFTSSDRVRRVVLPVALCVGLTAMLSACGEDPDKGTNGVGKLTAPEIERQAQTAVDAADAVRLSGALVTKGQTYRLNMRLKEDGGTGSVTSKDSTFELLRLKDALFLKADAGFWSQVAEEGEKGPADGKGGSAAADKLEDKYVRVPESDPAYKQLRVFTEMDVMLDGVLALQGKLSKGARDRIGGVRTIKLNGGETGEGGTLDVSLEGTPYPLQLIRAGGAGTLTLADWNNDFALEPPAKSQTVDYGSQLPSTGD